MAKFKDYASVRLTTRQFAILRGDLAEGLSEMGRKLEKAQDPAEKEFYRKTMIEFEQLENVLRKSDPRQHDTSQDVDEDDDDGERDEDEDEED